MVKGERERDERMNNRKATAEKQIELALLGAKRLAPTPFLGCVAVCWPASSKRWAFAALPSRRCSPVSKRNAEMKTDGVGDENATPMRLRHASERCFICCCYGEMERTLSGAKCHLLCALFTANSESNVHCEKI